MKKYLILSIIALVLMMNYQKANSNDNKSSICFGFGSAYMMSQDNKFNTLLQQFGYTNFFEDDFLMYRISMLALLKSNFYYGIDFNFNFTDEIRKNASESFNYDRFLINLNFGYQFELFNDFTMIPNLGMSIGSFYGDLIKNYNAGPINIDDLLNDNELSVIELSATEIALFLGLKFNYKLPIFIIEIGDKDLKFLNNLWLSLDTKYNYSFSTNMVSGKKEVDNFETVFFRGLIIGLGVEYVF